MSDEKVSSEDVRKKRRTFFKSKKAKIGLIIGIAIVLVSIIAATCFFVFYKKKPDDKPNTESTSKSDTTSADNSTADDIEPRSFDEKVQVLVMQGKTDEANQLINDKLKSTSDGGDLASVYMTQASANANQGKYNEAIASAQSALEKTDNKSYIYTFQADMYNRLGDKASADACLNNAENALDKTSDSYETQHNSIQHQKESLSEN